ncbi:MAG: hypothetical protein HUU57_00960 [Bdellovibrio sp.]|nr:hypothetical protein [Bdellovibrio sp.]
MNHESYSFAEIPFPKEWSIPEDCTGRILISGQGKSTYETHYLLDFSKRQILCCQINVDNYINELISYLKDRLPLQNLPFGATHFEVFAASFMQPHEGLETEDGRILVALHDTNFLRVINFETRHVGRYPEHNFFSPTIMSQTNSLDAKGENLFYSETSLDARIQSLIDGSPILTKVFEVGIDFKSKRLIGELYTNEPIHEVKYCPDEQHLLLTEFCLRGKGKVPDYFPGIFEATKAWESYEQIGLFSGQLYSMNLQSGYHEKTFTECFTPAHVEFSGIERDTFFLSSHNLSKIHGKIALHGNGEIKRGRLRGGKVEWNETYTDPEFFRVTSHKVYSYRGRSKIAATVFPNKIYIFDEPKLQVTDIITLFEHETIPPNQFFICNPTAKTSTWLETSDNGRYLIAASNEYIYLYDQDQRNLNSLEGYNFCGPFTGTAHICNLNGA